MGGTFPLRMGFYSGLQIFGMAHVICSIGTLQYVDLPSHGIILTLRLTAFAQGRPFDKLPSTHCVRSGQALR